MIWTIWQHPLWVILIILQQCLANKEEAKVAEMAKLMKETRIIPLIIDKPPKHKCEMYYQQNSEEVVYVETGKRMRDYETNKIPKVSWPLKPDTIYTLYMLGMSPMDTEKYWVDTVEGYDYNKPVTYKGTRPAVIPEVQQWEQWIVINIPFNNITGGDEILPYLHPRVPDVNITEHYVMLIYAQPHRIAMASDEVKNYMGYIFGPHHSVRRFTTKYSLEDLWAGNFFYAQKKFIPDG